MEKGEYRLIQENIYLAFILHQAQYSARHREYTGSKGNRYVNNYLQSSVLSTTIKEMYTKGGGNPKKGTPSAMIQLLREGDSLA